MSVSIISLFCHFYCTLYLVDACNVSRLSCDPALSAICVLLITLYSICNGIALAFDNCNLLIINKHSKIYALCTTNKLFEIYFNVY